MDVESSSPTRMTESRNSGYGGSQKNIFPQNPNMNYNSQGYNQYPPQNYPPQNYPPQNYPMMNQPPPYYPNPYHQNYYPPPPNNYPPNQNYMGNTGGPHSSPNIQENGSKKGGPFGNFIMDQLSNNMGSGNSGKRN